MPVDPPPGVLVLGMHRSGTSVATRLVHQLGPAMSTDAIGATDWNPRGLWESQSLIRLNDRILAETGHTWWYPPPEGPHYADAMQEIDGFVAEATDAFGRVHPSYPWVWKDPRTSLLIPFWRGVLGRPAGVLVLRHPFDVARSLERRNAMPLRLGIALWERYNRLILQHAPDMPMFVVRYDDLLDDTANSMTRLHSFLRDLHISMDHVPEAVSAEPSVVDRSLRHSEAGMTGFSGDMVAQFASACVLYEQLESVLGTTDGFAHTTLPPEEAWVSDALREWGPQRPPRWQEPPR